MLNRYIKKIFCFMCIMVCWVILPISSQAFTDYYSAYRNDPQYAIGSMHQGFFYVMDLDSVYVKLYHPPLYIIAGTITVIDNGYKNQGPVSQKEVTYRLNYDTKQIDSYNESTGSWDDQSFTFNRDPHLMISYYNKIFYRLYDVPFF